ncbi:MAG: hypothetical protein LBR83_07395, partial [Clostridiales bacterium]|nr:hypothetical protein [Clostridiales bacterium]
MEEEYGYEFSEKNERNRTQIKISMAVSIFLTFVLIAVLFFGAFINYLAFYYVFLSVIGVVANVYGIIKLFSLSDAIEEGEKAVTRKITNLKNFYVIFIAFLIFFILITTVWILFKRFQTGEISATDIPTATTSATAESTEGAPALTSAPAAGSSEATEPATEKTPATEASTEDSTEASTE